MKRILVLILCFSNLIAFAQVPQGVGYQGVATDANGIELVNQSISIRASVISASPSGTIEWQEIHNTSTDTFGLFNLTIGQGTSTGNGTQTSFADISWGSATHFLKIEMDVNGGTNYSHMGTNQMMSVPYALYAENANIDYDSISTILSNDSTFVTSVGGGIGGGFDLRFPQGYHGEPIIQYLTRPSNYFVPAGKVLYITHWYSRNSDDLEIVFNGDGRGILRWTVDHQGYEDERSNLNPLIIGENDTIQTSGAGGTGYFVGLLMDASSSVIPVSKEVKTGASYIVPQNKKFVITNSAFYQSGSLDINSLPVANTSGYERVLKIPIVVKAGDTISSIYTTINGYLVDENYFANSGGGGNNSGGGNNNSGSQGLISAADVCINPLSSISINLALPSPSKILDAIIDDSANVYVLHGYPNNGQNGSGGVLEKYDSLFNLTWSKTFSVTPQSIKILDNNLYISGAGSGSIDGISFSGTGFIAKINKNNNNCIWANALQGNQTWTPYFHFDANDSVVSIIDYGSTGNYLRHTIRNFDIISGSPINSYALDLSNLPDDYKIDQSYAYAIIGYACVQNNCKETRRFPLYNGNPVGTYNLVGYNQTWGSTYTTQSNTILFDSISFHEFRHVNSSGYEIKQHSLSNNNSSSQIFSQSDVNALSLSGGGEKQHAFFSDNGYTVFLEYNGQYGNLNVQGSYFLKDFNYTNSLAIIDFDNNFNITNLVNIAPLSDFEDMNNHGITYSASPNGNKVVLFNTLGPICVDGINYPSGDKYFLLRY